MMTMNFIMMATENKIIGLVVEALIAVVAAAMRSQQKMILASGIVAVAT